VVYSQTRMEGIETTIHCELIGENPVRSSALTTCGSLLLSSHISINWNSRMYEGISKSLQTWVDNEITIMNTHWEATQMVTATKLTRLTHKIAIQLPLVAESCTICSSRLRWQVRKLLDIPSYTMLRCVSSGCGWRRRPPDVEGNCKCITYAVSDSRQWVVLQLGGLLWTR
jgi:hypothetical protein